MQIEEMMLKNIALWGTPCLLSFPNQRGRCLSCALWYSERPHPVIAFSADSVSARISIHAISHVRMVDSADVPNILAASSMDTVFASKNLGSPIAFNPMTKMKDIGIIA